LAAKKKKHQLQKSRFRNSQQSRLLLKLQYSSN
jgi:hypothetical protein